ncbi:putative transcriptional regulator [[Actinomadura] parvosata subsp. kistnae]|uniref:helix-turn-helix transcriptional regulator n=1 Tax=[Actinomadura] parvosata TaxID=1955412 RepID=UPI000D26D7FC|nr:LuxR family transcriptional regulator [Nonomuraea sp. ATCC 55076]SPL96438.1 putative transcriptional regulator [Actinomadura parvosata subsp. kistnae]
MSSSAPRRALRGRHRECEALDRLLTRAKAGESQVVVLRGEAGVGKSALVDHLVAGAAGCQVLRAVGVESEMELAFAGLHQLCMPLMGHLEHLPGPQRDALAVAFGLTAGSVPDRFLVGLAVLSLLAEAAEERPLVCVVDDAQWLDQVSAQTLAFVGRRLLAERVALVFAVRTSASSSSSSDDPLRGLRELPIRGLRDDDARALLDSVVPGRLDERVRDRIVAETRGNPLALLELPRGLTAADLAGGFGRPDARPLASQIEQSFLRRIEALPAATQRLLLAAAAEPVGDVSLLWRVADRLGIGPDAAAAAEAAGLVEFGTRTRFRHPLVRSAAYRAADLAQRQDVHRALAEATDPASDPDRRAWHRAHAAVEPDEAVAAELERSAGRAQARGGLAAAAAFLKRATELTPDPAARGARAVAAAQATFEAGAPDAALELLAAAEMGPLDELRRGRLARLRGQIVFARRRGGDALPLLLDAAKVLERVDAGQAREAYLEAIGSAVFAGRLGGRGGVRQVAEAARAAGRDPRPPSPSNSPPAPPSPSNTPLNPSQPGDTPLNPSQPGDTPLDPCSPADTSLAPPQPGDTPLDPRSPTDTSLSPPRLADALLDGLATRFAEGYVAGAPLLKRVLRAFRQQAGHDRDAVMRWLWLTWLAAGDMWDDETWHELTTHALQAARETGALNFLPLALTYRAAAHVHAGDFEAAAALIAESDAITEATRNSPLAYASLLLLVWRGSDPGAAALVESNVRDATTWGEGRAIGLGHYLNAVLHNGLGRYETALASAQQSGEHEDLGVHGFSLVELVEAAARCDTPEVAAPALRRLEEQAGASGTSWARGVLARSKALLTEGPAADPLYREAIDHLQRSRIAVHLARTHLVYGEWLRRENRRLDARRHLRTAYEMLHRFGARAYAERARRELAATGEPVLQDSTEAPQVLTNQEAQIARLAADGKTNSQIGAELFISPRTVEWHLRKVFIKLDVDSRNKLRGALSGS